MNLAAALAGFVIGLALGIGVSLAGMQLRGHDMGMSSTEVQRAADTCIAQHHTWTPIYDQFGVAVLAIRCNPEPFAQVTR